MQHNYGNDILSPLQYSVGKKQVTDPAHIQGKRITEGHEYQVVRIMGAILVFVCHSW